MSATIDKAKISGLVGFVGAIATLFSSFASLFILAGFGLFFLTLMIQYGSIKFKLVTSFGILISFVVAYITEGNLPSLQSLLN